MLLPAISAFDRGARLLLDRDGLAAAVVPHTFAAPLRRPPSAQAFALACDTFWHVAVYSARQLTRYEL